MKGGKEKGPKTPRRNAKSPRRGQKVVIQDSDLESIEEYSSSGDDEAGQSSVQKYVEQLSLGLGLVASPKLAKKRKSAKKDSETSSDEERWLDAIQSGKLDEVDEELRKVKSKDPKLMTARQRAMLERNRDGAPTPATLSPVVSSPVQAPYVPPIVDEPLVALPSGYKETVLTEEDIQRKALKSLKRKEKADEKREKDKKKTMERLLKKQEAKTLKSGSKRGGRKSGPVITYVDNAEGPRILLPPSVNFPLEGQKSQTVPTAILCRGPGCSKLKRYSCKKTGLPLCSLECYRQVNSVQIVA